MNAIASLDAALLHPIIGMQTPAGVRLLSILTELGSGPAVVGISALACLFFWHRGYQAYAVGLLVSVGGSIATSELVKRIVERARPPVEWHAVVETGFSFTSNHAAASAALYGFLAFASLRLAPRQWRMPLASVCGAIILAVGFSRIYLGVHYPSDVLAGYALGAFFAWVGTRAVEKFR